MKALLILVLTILAGWLLTVGLGIVSFGLALVVGWMIKKDPHDEMIGSFMAICGGLAVLGLALGAMGF